MRAMNVTSSPKQKFIDAAFRLFAERGFHGVSLADVASDLNLTKQSVLYHFKTKEALYGAVLAKMAGHFDAIVADVRSHNGDGQTRLRYYLTTLHDHMRSHPMDARLIARELLDNIDRVDDSHRWYLRDFLDASVALLAEVPGWSDSGLDVRMAAVTQWIGAINYASIADPTLGAIWGSDRQKAASAAFLETLIAQASR
ncbi:TetR family transcriptional regulator [Mameliella alba]|nr:TetR family transcriptional regulator [Mameliella alba]MBY6168049.1 TetR family transcriptional regulator [Mameliella alba]MBY6173070.1 TetR family transcriptional regulator [Mameliella alba]